MTQSSILLLLKGTHWGRASRDRVGSLKEKGKNKDKKRESLPVKQRTPQKTPRPKYCISNNPNLEAGKKACQPLDSNYGPVNQSSLKTICGKKPLANLNHCILRINGLFLLALGIGIGINLLTTVYCSNLRTVIMYLASDQIQYSTSPHQSLSPMASCQEGSRNKSIPNRQTKQNRYHRHSFI